MVMQHLRMANVSHAAYRKAYSQPTAEMSLSTQSISNRLNSVLARGVKTLGIFLFIRHHFNLVVVALPHNSPVLFILLLFGTDYSSLKLNSQPLNVHHAYDQFL